MDPADMLRQDNDDHFSRPFALALDQQDPLRHLRAEFLIPSKQDLKGRGSPQGAPEGPSPDLSIYLCGNSLGVQPRRTSVRVQQYFDVWATLGVFGHFKTKEGSPLSTWVDADDAASKMIAPILGADPSELAVMETLTANLHFLMAAFYRPDKNGRHKIILESKAFPSDHYAVESQIYHHNLQPATSMVTIEPPDPVNPILSTSYILSIIDQHASTTAVLLLPGVQFYSGQYFDIPTITAHARSLGIFVIWDLAHAVGNVPLHLHDWDVDAAAWCSYKYLNSGPGAIGGLFVHSRNALILPSSSSTPSPPNPPRLSGWWGSDKASRFAMTNHFTPLPGAAGFQLSNPSIIDTTALCASLEVFALTDMAALRAKSLKLTAYLEAHLQRLRQRGADFAIITPTDPAQRGAQLSLKLGNGLLEQVMEELEARAVVVDERRPDVIRVAPAPLYNSFADVWDFVVALEEAMGLAQAGRTEKVGAKEVEG